MCQPTESITASKSIYSVSNRSGYAASVPVFGQRFDSVWFVTHPKIPNRNVLVGLLAGPDQNPMFFHWVGAGPQIHFAVSTVLAPIEYLSFDRIMT
jgi:hypothetical protein